jgi:hypothetical protein
MSERLLRAYKWYGRFVGLAVLIYSGLLLVINLAELIAGSNGYEGFIMAWILASGVVGIIGSLAFLAGLDGPDRTRTKSYRLGGWLVMLAACLLPSSVTFFLLPLTIVAVGLAVRNPQLSTS